MARRKFVLDSCNELQTRHKNVLNVWSRAHGKTTLEEALTIQQLLLNPEATIGLFAYNRSLSKKILSVIKHELEQNARLKRLSWDPGIGAQIFWDDPQKEAPSWGLNEGIVVNRRTNQVEASVEAWGLVESMPVGRHFLIRKYDDVSTHESVTTQDMIEKTVTALSLSQALGKPGGWAEYYGTFYAYGDPLHSLLKSGVDLRLKPCYEVKGMKRAEDGSIKRLDLDHDKPVYYTKEELEEYIRHMGPVEIATQMWCDPRAGAETFFREDWLQYYRANPFDEGAGKNVYILIDPAMAKDKDASYTVMWVVGLGTDGNRYLLDGLRDRIGLAEKAKHLFRLHRLWNPIEVRYERYAMQADIAYMREKMEREGYRFHIREVGGIMAKDDRIARLVPLFSDGKWYLPRELRKVREDGASYDLVAEFVNEEYLKWPTCSTKDMLDALARIEEPDIPLIWPKGESTDRDKWKKPGWRSSASNPDAWMLA